jgi:hypothetical protein
MTREQALAWLATQEGEAALFLLAWIGEIEDRAIRFDLDQAGILQREAEAVELVELRAERDRLNNARGHGESLNDA